MVDRFRGTLPSITVRAASLPSSPQKDDLTFAPNQKSRSLSSYDLMHTSAMAGVVRPVGCSLAIGIRRNAAPPGGQLSFGYSAPDRDVLKKVASDRYHITNSGFFDMMVLVESTELHR